MASHDAVFGGIDPSLLGALLAPSEAAIALVRGQELRIVYGNPAYHRLFGWPLDSSLTGLGPTAAPLADAAAAVIAHGKPVRVNELPLGGLRHTTVLCSAAGDGVLMVGFEVTDQALARLQAEDRSERLAALDQATAAVTAGLDPHRELTSLAHAVVPKIADACAIYLVDPGSRRSGEPVHATRLVCVIDPSLPVAAPSPEIRLTIAADRPVAQAVSGRQGVIASGPELQVNDWGEGWLREVSPHSVVALPLGLPDVDAVVKFVAAGARPQFRPADLELIQEIATRADLALGHARRMQRANQVAVALQRGLLSDPVAVGRLEIAVRYRPATAELEVGGDWYDTFTLPDGGVGLAVGDVVGHDVSAVSTMSQLRSMVRALACQPGAAPAGVLTSLNQLVTSLGTGRLATMIYGRLTPNGSGAGALTYARAGHPPALLVGPDREVTLLDLPDSPLLGLAPHTYQAGRVTVPPGGTLLLYTDGLLEDPNNPRDDPVSELVATLRSGPTAPDELADRLLARAPTADDIALLVVRVRE